MRSSQSFTANRKEKYVYKHVPCKINSETNIRGIFYNPCRYIFDKTSCLEHPNVSVAYDQATRKRVVLKKCRNIESELKVLREFNDCNIIQKMKQYDLQQKIIIYDYNPYGDLLEYTTKVRKLTWDESKNIVLLPILRALQYMHNLDYAHRYIKQENILYYPDGCKLIDFEFCRKLPESGYFEDMTGTLECMAPEVFNRKSCLESDLWALGIVYYECLHQKNPFGSNRDIKSVRSDILNMKITINLSLDIDDIGVLKILLNDDPEYRKHIHKLFSETCKDQQPVKNKSKIFRTNCLPW